MSLQDAGQHDADCRRAPPAARRPRASAPRARRSRGLGVLEQQAAENGAASASSAESGRRTIRVHVEHRRGCLVGVLAPAGAELAGDDRHSHGGEDAAGGHLEDDVGEHVHRLVDVAHPAGTDAAREDEDARESGHAGEQGRHRDDPAAFATEGPTLRARSSPAPGMSGPRSGPPEGVELAQARGGLDDPREADPLRRQRQAVSTARAASRPRRPLRATRAEPSRAPALLAPVSPSIVSPARSGPRRAAAAPTAAPETTSARRSAAVSAPRDDGRLERPPRPEVEEVEQVRRAGDHRATHQGVEGRSG